MKHLFEDGNEYTIGEASNSELGIIIYGTVVSSECEEYLKFLRQRYNGPIDLEFGPGRHGEPPYEKLAHPTIGLNPFADPKSDLYYDLGKGIPLPNASVDSAYGNQFLEHIGGEQRIHFMNELFRVLIPGGLAVFDVPDYRSPYACGDPTHKWPPFSDVSFQYFCVTRDGSPFVSGFSDYGITARFMFDKPQKVIPGVSIHVELRKLA